MSDSLKDFDFAYREHCVRRGNGNGGWDILPARYRMLNFGPEKHLFPYGLHLMDNGEVIFLGGLHADPPQAGSLGGPSRGTDTYACVAAFSTDNGESWTEVVDTGVYGRPVATAYLGAGTVLFANETLARRDLAPQWTISTDYGRTWSKHAAVPPSVDGKSVFGEGDVYVERTDDGQSLVQTVAAHGPNFPFDRHYAYIRFSEDQGKTWTREISPPEWVWQEDHGQGTIERCVCEGSVIRASNGWLVAALRTDVPPRYMELRYDNLMGIAISLSKDNGHTWSELNRLYEAGRHHTNLLRLSSGEIVLTHIVRLDVRDGRLASYRHGCEAIVSRDNGQSWDIDHKYVLDDFAHINAEQWYQVSCGHLSSTILGDGSILTAYGHYLSRGVGLIRWKPE